MFSKGRWAVRITHLELENFKSYQQVSVPFLPGTNAIIGANGAGKSTLLEAIGFALFDYRPAGFRLASLLREGAASSSVIVRFISSYDECEYEVERRFTAQSTTRYRVYAFDSGRACISEGNQEVNDWLHEHLCVDPSTRLDDLFDNTVGVPQGTLTAPFQESASQRKALFDPLLRVDEYRKASDGLLATERYLGGRAAELREEIARLEGQLTELPKLQEEEQALQKTIAELDTRIASLREELAKATASLEELDQAEQSLRDAAMRVEKTRSELAVQKERLSEAQRAFLASDQARTQVASSQAGYDAYRQADVQLKELETQRTSRAKLLKTRHQLEQQETQIRSQLDQLGKELEEIAAAAHRMEALAPAVKQQEALEAALATARADAIKLEEAQRRDAQAAEEVERAEEEVREIRDALQEAATLEGEAARIKVHIDAATRSEQDANERRITLNAESARLRAQSTTLSEAQQARCPVCEAELTPAHRAELLERNARRLQELESESAAQAELIQARRLEKEEAQQELDGVQQRLRHLPSEDDLQRAEQRFARHQASQEQAQADIAAFEDAPSRIETQIRDLEALGDPRRVYQGLEDKARQREAIEQQQKAQRPRLEEVVEEISHLTEELSAFANLDDAIRQAQETRERSQPAYDTYVANSRVAEQYAQRQAAVKEVAAACDALEESLADLISAQEVAESAYDSDRHTQLRQAEGLLREQVTRAEAQLEGQQVRLRAVMDSIGHLEDLEGKLAGESARLQDTEAQIAIVKTVRALLRQAGPFITQQLVYRISCEASTLYASIMNDHTGRLHWAEDYELSLEVKGRKRTFRQLSGGEQMIAALALRLALLRETSAIDVAFFDEPTAHLDAERREGFAAQITQVRGFSQLFVISHDDTFEQAAQNYIHIIKDESGSHLEEE